MAKKTAKRKEYPTCAMLLACDLLVMDPNSSKPNLYGVFDKFNTPKLPATFRFSIYLKLQGGSGVYPLRIGLVGPDGKDIESATMDIEEFTPDPKKSVKIGGSFGAAEIKKKGDHKIVIKSGSHVIYESVPFPVELTK